MASSKEFRDYVLEQLAELKVTCRPMMGEYLLYKDGVYFGGVFDDRLLVKIVKDNAGYDMEQVLPYEGAKPMHLVEDLDDKEKLVQIVNDTCRGLKDKK
ncbi:MAG: TfoX/Sxy family protein [Christensenellales bacterium]